jgi:hypothetical protein
MNNHAISYNEYELPVIIRGNVQIEWVNLDEGHDGDYDPSDKHDENLLRFDVSRFDGKNWEAVADGSYCTRVASTTPQQILIEHLEHFMAEIYDDVSEHGKAKRICESLSWTK